MSVSPDLRVCTRRGAPRKLSGIIGAWRAPRARRQVIITETFKKYHTVLYDQTKIIRNNLDAELRQFSFNFNYRYSGSDIVSPHITNSPPGQTVYTNTQTKISNMGINPFTVTDISTFVSKPLLSAFFIDVERCSLDGT